MSHCCYCCCGCWYFHRIELWIPQANEYQQCSPSYLTSHRFNKLLEKLYCESSSVNTSPVHVAKTSPLRAELWSGKTFNKRMRPPPELILVAHHQDRISFPLLQWVEAAQCYPGRRGLADPHVKVRLPTWR